MVPLILYSLLSFLTLKGEPLYSIRVDIDWSGKYITYIKTKEDVFLGIDVIPFESYIEYSMKKAVGSLWRDVVQEIITEEVRTGEGLIPNIYIPIKFPKPVVGLIGEGGELRISGNERIEFGGSSTQEIDPIYTETYHRSLLPQLEMEQQLRVNLQGTIGKKIHVFIDHDSKREFDIRNTIRLQYKGDEDEIIKEINAGNTDISLPGGLIGAPRANKGLFGVKLLAEVGPFNITAIASKQESEVQQKNFVGGAIEDSTKLWDTDFISNRFFMIKDEYIDSIIEVRLYRSANQNEQDSSTSTAGVAIDYNREGIPDSVDNRFILLEQGDNKDFVLNRNDGIIELKRTFNYVGFVLIYRTPGGVVDTIGDDIPSTITLRMLKRMRNDKDPEFVSWDYEMKYIYALPAANISPGSFEMKIFKDKKGAGEDEEFVSGETTFLQYFGMAKHDGTIDDGNYVDYDMGIVIFPFEKPFLELPDPDSIYDVRITANIGRKYYIWMRYKGIQKRYSLGLNILEGSERVVMDGKELTRGVHYDINYDFGELTFRTGVITDPNARISIDYQYLPFMQTASKNLLGARLNYDRGVLKFGSTFIYHSSSSFDKRPKLGNEPTQILLGEIDGRYSTTPALFTKLVDLIPLVETDAPSSFGVNFDVGLSAPNPNTKGEVYIDDMEGTRSSTSLGIGRTNWSYGSAPPDKNLNDFEPLRWYNPREKIKRVEIFPYLPEYRQEETQTILRLECGGGWGSLLSLISRDGADFEKSEFLEVWARGDGKIHIDIGSNIHEEALYKDKWGNIKRNLDPNYPRTEDINGNGKLDSGQGEDTGLDGVMKDDKLVVSEEDEDDGNDDYSYTLDSDDYSRINGTEKNGRLDTEDLDKNSRVNTKSDYFSFEINLRSDENLIQEGENGWRLYRIPLHEAVPIGNPRWSFVRYTRLWIERDIPDEERIPGKNYDLCKSVDTIDIAIMEIVGNRWEKRGDIELSYRDNQENTGEPPYEPPYPPERDQYGREERESSLSIIFKDGAEGSAYTLYGTKKEFIQYNTFALYLNGVNLIETNNTRFFIRVGGDTLNYYEYTVNIPDNWRDIKIPLDSLTHLKRERDTLPQDSIFGRVFVGDDSCFVLGNPSLTNIKMVEVGIKQGPDSEAEGEVWVDDIRLLDVEKNIGLAASASTTLKFADFVRLDLTYSRQDPYFRKFGQEMVPQGGYTSSYAVKFDLGLGKFLPSSWGVNIPVSGGMSNTTKYPMYSTNSDIVLSDEEGKNEKTITKPRNINVSFSKSKSKNTLLKYTIDNIAASASYRENFTIGPTKIDSTKNINITASYGCTPNLSALSLFGFDIRYYPNNFNIRTNYSRADMRSYSVSRDSIKLKESPNPVTRTDQASISYSPINAITTSYSVKSTNELNYSRETSRDENLACNFSPNIWNYTSQKFAYTTRYNEINSIEKFEIVNGDTANVRDATNTNSIDVDLTINLQKIGDKLGFIRGLTRLITSPSLSYSLSRSTGIYSLLGRPSREFIFGLSSDYGVGKLGNAKDSEKEITDITASTGFKLGILSLSFAYRESESWGGTIDNKRWSMSKTLPDMRFSLSSLERFFRLKNILSSVSLSSNFKISESFEGYTVDEATQKSRDISLTPSLNLQWKSGISSRINTTFTKKYTKTRTGANKYSEKEDRHFDIGLSGSYTFSAPSGIKLPLFSHIRFAGNLVTNLEIKYLLDTGENVTIDSKSKDRYRFSITPGMNYNFSSDITGGARIEYREDNDRMTRMHTRTVGMTVWAEFRF